MIIFSLGIFVTVASIIRLRTLVLFANSTNITYEYVDAAYWSTIELYAGIICASLPAVYKLFSALGLTPRWTAVKIKMSGGSSGKTPEYSGKASKGTSNITDRLKTRQISSKRDEDSEFIRLADVETGTNESGKTWQ
ncbi:CFEM domain-containing protein [Diaporthe helianthi]|uniref:CFEM domain-containing protein n=1 Tax=Diaporthe helianthi TaxID=158607 RepID=A0A2P5HNX9_DIAHE|nr:CFEM domain-containing protein [Diaporthe helianthi]